MTILEILEILVYATCMALKIFGELFGYWFILVILAALKWELTDTLLSVAAILALAWFFVSRLLIFWTGG